MAVAVILLGMLSGLASVMAALIFGAPLWVALLVYPLAGVLSVGVFVAFAVAPRNCDPEDSAPVRAEA